MKKNWQQKKVSENCMGLHFTRWYVISPSGNVYNFYRSCYSDTIYFKKDMKDCKKNVPIAYNYNDAIKKIYAFEEQTKKCEKFATFIKKLSSEIRKDKEFQTLYSMEANNYSYYSY
jgi:hypothetical protein